jgi:hypothetical protein
MKKFLVFVLLIFSVFIFSSCKEEKSPETKTSVVINLPADNSVNGYRTGKIDYSDDISSKQDNSPSGNSSYLYCVNVNSGVFHKSECGSVGKMKEENKSYFNKREEAISQGYKPCGRCNP